jgi:hypothetical protein
LKKGSPNSPSFKMNLFRAAMHPVSFCTSLMHVGAFMLVMAEILSGLKDQMATREGGSE